MTEPAAFRGVLSAIRPLKTSGDVQFIITVPAHEANNALEKIGGFVVPSESRWVGVARITSPNEIHAGEEHENVASGDTLGRREPSTYEGAD